LCLDYITPSKGPTGAHQAILEQRSASLNSRASSIQSGMERIRTPEAVRLKPRVPEPEKTMKKPRTPTKEKEAKTSRRKYCDKEIEEKGWHA